jgi:kynureninase
MGGHFIRHSLKRRSTNSVRVDLREPDGIRLGLSPLSTNFSELFAAVTQIRETARNSVGARSARSLVARRPS